MRAEFVRYFLSEYVQCVAGESGGKLVQTRRQFSQWCYGSNVIQNLVKNRESPDRHSTAD